MFDAVHVVVSAVRELNRSQEIGVKPLACTSANIWPHGTSLMNYLRMVRLALPAQPLAASQATSDPTRCSMGLWQPVQRGMGHIVPEP